MLFQAAHRFDWHALTMKHMSMVLLIGMAVTRIVSTLAIVKVISAVFGPEAFGELSHVIGISAVFYMFAGGGVANGLIRHVAVSKEPHQRAAWLKAASVISIASALALGVLCVVLYLWSGAFVLLDAELAPLFLVIAAAQGVIGLGNTALAFLSGIGNIKAFVVANAAGSIVAAGLVVVAVQFAGLQGAFLTVAILPLAPSVIGVALLVRQCGDRQIWPATTNRLHVIELLRFSGAMVVGVVAVPVVQAFMRVGMADRLGWESVGHWQAIARVSDAYMQVFGVLFINLMLPQLARVSGSARRVVAMRLGAAFTVLFLVGTAAYYLLRHQIILIAFSPEFLPAADLVLTQSLGDLCKIGCWILVYVYVAGGLLRVQIAAELAQATLTVLSFVLLAPGSGQAAAVRAHAIACAVVFLGLVVMALRGRFMMPRKTTP